MLRWSRGSFSLSNGSSYSKRNFEGTGHSRIALVKGESVLLSILSRLRFIFSLIAFLNSSISFLISLRRLKLAPSRVTGHRRLSLLWLSPSLSQLVSEWLSSCCSCSLISWFYLVSSSTLVASIWICRANTARSWLVLDSIWAYELNGTTFSNLGAKKVISHRQHQTDDAKIINWDDHPVGELTKIIQSPARTNEWRKKEGIPMWCLPQSLQWSS